MMFAGRWGISPFEILKSDIDDLLLITQNYLKQNQPSERAVNKKTKSGDGFWDF